METKTDLCAAGLVSFSFSLEPAGSQAGLGLSVELVCPVLMPFRRWLTRAGRQCPWAPPSTPQLSWKPQEHPDVQAVCKSGAGGSWQGRALAILSLSISNLESCLLADSGAREWPGRLHLGANLSAGLPEVVSGFQSPLAPFKSLLGNF